MSCATFAAQVRSILEYAPADPGPLAPGLRGWWHKADDGEVYICSRCAGRMIGRGFHLPRDMEAVWADAPEPFGVCVGCEPWRGVPSLDRYCPCGECGLDRSRWSPECRREAGAR